MRYVSSSFCPTSGFLIFTKIWKSHLCRLHHSYTSLVFTLVTILHPKNMNNYYWYSLLHPLQLRNVAVLSLFILEICWSKQGCHFSTDRRISAFLLFLWAANCIISLFFGEKIASFLVANNQWSNVASKCSNIQSFSIHNINISIHLNLIFLYSTIYK